MLIAIDDLLKDFRPRHSEFQIDRFIVGLNGVTEYGCYQQALRELHARKQSREQNQFQRESLTLQIDEWKQERRRLENGAKSGFKRRKLDLNIRMAERALQEHLKTEEDSERELRRFHEIATELKKKLGDLNDARRAELEEEFWLHKVRLMIAMDIIATGWIDRGTLETIAVLPDDIRTSLLASVSHVLGEKTAGKWRCMMNEAPNLLPRVPMEDGIGANRRKVVVPKRGRSSRR